MKYDYLLMSAGPTSVSKEVMEARSRNFGNPDLDYDFYNDYMDICKKFEEVIGTKSQCLIMSGEGILGLEAACASLTEEGDRVLVLDNGVFGKGFGEFVEMYKGEAVYFTSDYKKAIEPKELELFLEKDSDFKYATMVHCDTPTGVLNPVNELSKVLKSKGILTVVDSVAGMFGEELRDEEGVIDILCGGSQKALSVPPGLTMLWVSEDAFKAMDNRKNPIPGFYCNIKIFKEFLDRKEFTYTQPISDIIGLKKGLEIFIEENQNGDVFKRHDKIAKATRKALLEAGLELYLESDWANTVTAVKIPEGIKEEDIMNIMLKEYGVMISGSLGEVKGQVVRLGHMGENCKVDKMKTTLIAFQKTLESLGFKFKTNLKDLFLV